ncbi:PP2C family protein-serine/threonine phosphatase [Streptomyces albipurpureus]|uniref:Serine/threonine-protein phosphatase n=1 Tax=Streptomyces albipurpureus TaxID=2897419 RepID=A0ABT0UNA6_9ACTN|nr:PP2C family protein-serine/threonine phosphatase [Streptomyces sp. CWNU-1]MCM2389940.1 serine/threonine-protein phosphatase [Streptomyces sp. CWNU-1]
MDRLTTRWPYARWFPLALVIAAAVFDVTTPDVHTGVPLIASACVLAGGVLTFRGAAWTGAFALGVTVLLDWQAELLTSATGWSEIFNVLIAVVFGLDLNRMLDRHSRQLATVRSVAEAIQRAVLPTPPPRIGPLEVSARYEAADAEARIGGDAYAIQDTPFGVRIIMGDVRGKGLGAVSTISTLIGAFREAAHCVPDIGELAVRLEQSLERDSVQHHLLDRDEEFTTALIAQIDHHNHTLEVINRGHPDPYLIRGGRITALTATTPDLPLGMGDLTAQRAEADHFPLFPGDVLLFVTDGVTEARNHHGTFYDPVTDLHLLTTEPTTPTAVLDELANGIHRWTGGPRDDDMATLAVTIS